MKKTAALILILFFVLFLAISGCKKNDSPSSPGGDSNPAPVSTSTDTWNPSIPTYTFTETSTITETATPTVTYMETSTPDGSANITGNLNLPAAAPGKQFFVIFDDDTNPGNGVGAGNGVIGVCGSNAQVSYQLSVSPGNYYIAALVDMNGDGFDEPANGDYFGEYNGTAFTAVGASGTYNITLNALATFTPTNTYSYTSTYTFTDTNTFTETMTPSETATPGGDTATETATPTLVVTITLDLPASAAGSPYYIGLFDVMEYKVQAAYGAQGICPAGEPFDVTLTAAPGTYYLMGFIDNNANADCSDLDWCFPDVNDYYGIYGGTAGSPPASPNVTISYASPSATLNMSIASPNVSGMLNIPSDAAGDNYVILISTGPMNDEFSPVAAQEAVCPAGTSFGYSAFAYLQDTVYITGIVDTDGSGWENGENGPVSNGDYAGIYGVATPILNWENPFPGSPNASVPGSPFDIYCDTFSGSGSTETPTETATPGTGIGTISGTLTLAGPSTGLVVYACVDNDLNFLNGYINEFMTLTSGSGSVPYSLTSTTGDVYVYAWLDNDGDFTVSPGDGWGFYGTTYPAYPGSANVTVTESTTTSGTDISVVTAPANVTGRITYPAGAAGDDAGVVLDDDMDFNDYMALDLVDPLGPGTYYDYNILCPLPGTYYIYAMVDQVDPPDLYSGPQAGDYSGAYGSPSTVNITDLSAGGSFTFALSEVPGVSTATPTETATTVGGTGTVQGTLTLATLPSPGTPYEVYVDDDLNLMNGVMNSVQGTVGGTVFIPYSMTATAGNVYVYGWVDISQDYNISAGDFWGFYGTTYPAYPGTANVTVPSGSAVSSIDVYVYQATANIFGRINYPADASGVDAAIIIDTDTDWTNDMFGMEMVNSLGSGTSYDYNLLCPLPGTYYIYSLVDQVDPPDITSGPQTGDYSGYYGAPTSIIMSDLSLVQGFTFTLSVEP